MCGIFGIYHTSGETPAAARLAAMAKSLHHRGPDGHGHMATPHAAIGNTRLAIIDVAHGRQPFSLADGSIHVVQNGEIYNYIELKAELEAQGAIFTTHSDTEVLLHAYHHWGDDFVQRLNGMFAVAIIDTRDHSLRLYRDRIGMKPLYWAQMGDTYFFASEIKAILAAGMPARAHYEALHHFLSFNYMPSPFTAFENIHELPAGHMAHLTPSGIQVHSWWRLGEHTPQVATTEDAICDDLRNLLTRATEIHLRADVEVGAFLSGGVDSSTVVGVASHLLEQPMQSFSIGFDDAKYDESPFALEASKRFSTRHTLRRVQPNMLENWPLAVFFCDQPHGDVSFMPTYEVAKLARNNVKVVLTGDGGDELFAGYDKYLDFAKRGFTGGWQRDYFEATSLLTHTKKTAIYSDAMRGQFAHLDSFEITEDWQSRYAHCDPINQMLAFDSTFLLAGNNLVKPDRMSMAASLEGRMPLLDPSIIDYVFALPGGLKMKDGVSKYIMKKAFAPLIGDSLAYRKKQMFTVPIGDWLKTTLAPLMQNLLGSNQFAARGLFDAAAIRRMMDEHISGAANHTRILRALMAIEIWFRLYIDAQTLTPPTWDDLGLAMPELAA